MIIENGCENTPNENELSVGFIYAYNVHTSIYSCCAYVFL